MGGAHAVRLLSAHGGSQQPKKETRGRRREQPQQQQQQRTCRGRRSRGDVETGHQGFTRGHRGCLPRRPNHRSFGSQVSRPLPRLCYIYFTTLHQPHRMTHIIYMYVYCATLYYIGFTWIIYSCILSAGLSRAGRRTPSRASWQRRTSESESRQISSDNNRLLLLLSLLLLFYAHHSLFLFAVENNIKRAGSFSYIYIYI